MSLSIVRSYFRARLNSLGYKEWDDGFNVDNIPENIINYAYHIDNFAGTVNSMNQTDLDIDVNVTTRIFFKGYRTVKDALDTVDQKLEDIFVEVLKPTNRLTGTAGLRDVQLVEYTKEPITFSNDNTIVATLIWRVQVNICTT